MAKRIMVEGYNVTVFVPVGGDLAPRDALFQANTIKHAIIERIGPTIPTARNPTIETQSRDVCEFCGAKWHGGQHTVQDCCDADRAEAQARTKERDHANQ